MPVPIKRNFVLRFQKYQHLSEGSLVSIYTHPFQGISKIPVLNNEWRFNPSYLIFKHEGNEGMKMAPQLFI